MVTKHKKRIGLLITLVCVALVGLAIIGTLRLLRDDDKNYLVVLNAASGSADDSTLTLHNLEKQSLLFADRPDRDVRYVSPKGIVSLWNNEEIADDPPKAALTWREGDSTYTLVVELTNPEIQADGSLAFSYVPISDETGAITENMENVSVFVDAFPTTVNRQITD